MKILDFLFKRRSTVADISAATSPLGVSGAVGNAIVGNVYDADFESDERNPELQGRRKYEKYINMLANVNIITASVRYFLNLTARSKWDFRPSDSDSDEAKEYAKKASKIILEDPITSWHSSVRRMAMYRFFGFSVQEFTTFRRPDGVISVYDIMNRPQSTIREWHLHPKTQEIISVRQEHPVSGQSYSIPREKLLYIVDDTISDSPAGMGLLRHIVAAADALKRYEQLEGIAFDTDLRGIPIGRAPLSRLAQMVKAGTLSATQKAELEAPIRAFLKGHVKTSQLSMLLDSHPYHSQDEANRPSPQKQWDIELLKASSTSLEALARAVQRINREIARVLGTEQLMLGEDIAGSFALSKDKTQAFVLLVEGALKEMRTVVTRDILTPMWQLNGWPEDMMPKPTTESVNYKDIEEIARTFQYLALAGVPIQPDDPVLQELRDIAGLSRTPQFIIDRLVEFIGLQADDARSNLNEGVSSPNFGSAATGRPPSATGSGASPL